VEDCAAGLVNEWLEEVREGMQEAGDLVDYLRGLFQSPAFSCVLVVFCLWIVLLGCRRFGCD
jgi:hypothetical protein